VQPRPIFRIEVRAIIGRDQLYLGPIREIDGLVQNEAASTNGGFQRQRHRVLSLASVVCRSELRCSLRRILPRMGSTDRDERQGFAATVPFAEEHPQALAVYCSDGRFTEAVEELLASLGDRRIDTLTIPGGAALLHFWSAGHAEAETVRQAASFLIEAHRITRVVLVAHAGCGYYRRRHPALDDRAMADRQAMDLRRAASWLAGRHRGLNVAAYFAQPHVRHVAFLPVELEATGSTVLA